MSVNQKESGLMLGQTPNETMRAALKAVQEEYNPDNQIEFTDDQLENFPFYLLLQVASGEARFNRNPIAGTSQIHEWIGSTDTPPNGHDYI